MRDDTELRGILHLLERVVCGFKALENGIY